jgi:hypothetical protein
MNPHDTDRAERDPLGRPADPGPDDRPRGEREITKEIDRDRDGLPDEPAEYRVPS